MRPGVPGCEDAAQVGKFGALLVGCTSDKTEMLCQRVQGSRSHIPGRHPQQWAHSSPVLPPASSLESQLQMRVNPRSLKSQRHICGSLLPLFHSPSVAIRASPPCSEKNNFTDCAGPLFVFYACPIGGGFGPAVTQYFSPHHDSVRVPGGGSGAMADIQEAILILFSETVLASSRLNVWCS